MTRAGNDDRTPTLPGSGSRWPSPAGRYVKFERNGCIERELYLPTKGTHQIGLYHFLNDIAARAFPTSLCGYPLESRSRSLHFPSNRRVDQTIFFILKTTAKKYYLVVQFNRYTKIGTFCCEDITHNSSCPTVPCAGNRHNDARSPPKSLHPHARVGVSGA